MLRVITSRKFLFTVISIAPYLCHALAGAIVLEQDIATVAVSTDSPEATDINIESLRISVSDDGDIDIDLPLVVRNEIGFVLETESSLEAQSTQIQEVLINHNYDVQKKGLGSAAFAVEFAGMVATYIAVLGAKGGVQSIPIHLHFPHGGTIKQLNGAADGNPTPTVAIIQTDAQSPSGLIDIELVDKPDNTGTSAPSCSSGPIQACPSGVAFPVDLIQMPTDEGCRCAPTFTFNHAATYPASLVEAKLAEGSAYSAYSNATVTTFQPSQTTGPQCTSTSSDFGCSVPHCECNNGNLAPLLPAVVSGTKTFNCDYKTQPTFDNCPPPSTTTATCLPTTKTPAPTLNPADNTRAASSYCSSVLSNSPLGSASTSHMWIYPEPVASLLLNAALQSPIPSSCETYNGMDDCMKGMESIFQQCPVRGGSLSASCVDLTYAAVTVI